MGKNEFDLQTCSLEELLQHAYYQANGPFGPPKEEIDPSQFDEASKRQALLVANDWLYEHNVSLPRDGHWEQLALGVLVLFRDYDMIDKNGFIR